MRARRVVGYVAWAAWALPVAASCGSTPRPTTRAPRAQASVAQSYVVHEWGVIAYRAIERAHTAHARSGASTLRPLPPQPARVYKPVIYVQLDPPARERRFSLSIAPRNGRVLEHWPLGTLTKSGRRVEWANVIARNAPSCVTSYPSVVDPACESLADGLCEASEARAYETTDGACLRFEGHDYDHLLYRAAVPREALPYDVLVRGTETVLVRRRGARTAPVFRVVRDFGSRTTRVTRLPADTTTSITLDAPALGPEREGVRDELFATLAAVGLTAPEMAAFERAWAPLILDPPRRTDNIRDRPLDALYYWLEPEITAAVLPLSFSPPPREVHRALLVRIELPNDLASGTP